MKYNDSLLKEQVRAYQTGRSRDVLAALQTELASYIYHYPRKVFRRDHDAASAFYLYVFERLETVLLKFEDHGCLFTTWFTAVLRNHYLNFLRTTEDDAPLYSLTVNDRIIDIPVSDDGPEDDTRREVLASLILDEFSPRDALLFQMHYLELFKETIVVPLSHHLSITVDEALSLVHRARETYRKRYDRLLTLQDRLTRICSANASSPSRAAAKKKASLTARIDQIALTVPFKFIASVFAVTVNLVTKAVGRIKAFVRRHTQTMEAA